MAGQLRGRCCPVAGIGAHFLTPSSSPRPLPHLLGLTDQRLQQEMAKGHSYVFNMGHGHIIPFKDYKVAAKALMERNFPDILHDRQTKAVFLPETHLPKMPRLVDLAAFEKKKIRGVIEKKMIVLIFKNINSGYNARLNL